MHQPLLPFLASFLDSEGGAHEQQHARPPSKTCEGYITLSSPEETGDVLIQQALMPYWHFHC